jgi:multiple sugar transport system substrate-binding protein
MRFLRIKTIVDKILEKNLMKYRYMMLAILLVGLLSLSVATAQDVTSIRFGTLTGWSVDDVNAMLVEAFNEKHPDIEVQVEYVTDDYAGALTAQAAAGTLPDVVFIADLFVVPFVQNQIVLDMQTLAENDPDMDINDVVPIMLDLGRVEGDPGLYMIPSSYDVVTMYYNKTMFEEAGAPLPTAEWTWDDFIASCKIIKEQLDNFCMPAAQHNWWAWYVPWIVGYGGSLLAEDGRTVTLASPESLAGLTAYTNMWTVDGINQPLDFDAGGDCFFVGKCATSFTIAGQMSALRALDPQPFVWDVEVIPTLPNGKVTGMGTYGFAISANAQDPALAWDFVKNLLAPETQKAIAMSYAGTPLLTSLAEDPDILNREAPPENINAFLENGANGILPTYFPGECGSLYAGQIQQLINDAFDASLRGNETVESAFGFAAEEIQFCLDETIE